MLIAGLLVVLTAVMGDEEHLSWLFTMQISAIAWTLVLLALLAMYHANRFALKQV